MAFGSGGGLDFGKTMADIFRAFGQRFLLMVGLVIVINLCATAAAGGLAYLLASAFGTGRGMPTIVSWGLYALIICFSVFSYSALVDVGVGHLRGRETSFGSAIRAAVRNFPKVIGIAALLMLVLGVLFFSLSLVLGIIFGIATGPSGTSGWSPIMLLLLGAALGFVTVSLLSSIPAAQEEDLDILGAIGRSWELASGNRWKLFAVVVIIGALASLVILAMIFLVGAAGEAGMLENTAPRLAFVFVVQIGFTSIYWSLIATCHSAAYVNLTRAATGGDFGALEEIFA